MAAATTMTTGATPPHLAASTTDAAATEAAASPTRTAAGVATVADTRHWGGGLRPVRSGASTTTDGLPRPRTASSPATTTGGLPTTGGLRL